MSNQNIKNKSIITNALIFAVLSTAIALFAKSVDSSVFYIPVKADFNVVTFSDILKIAAEYAKSASVQMIILFISGFTHFPLIISSAVCAYRGICLGFAVSAVSTGTVLFPDKQTMFGIPCSVLVLGFYFLSTVLILLFASTAKSFSAYLKNNDTQDRKAMFCTILRYVLIFFIICGGVTVSEVIKCLLIK